VSYRDPNLLATLDIYDRTAEFLKGADLRRGVNDAQYHRHDRGDRYLPASDAKGFASMQRHLIGDTDAARQRMREEILSTTPPIFAISAMHGAGRGKGRVVVLARSRPIEAANASGRGC